MSVSDLINITETNKQKKPSYRFAVTLLFNKMYFLKTNRHFILAILYVHYNWGKSGWWLVRVILALGRQRQEGCALQGQLEVQSKTCPGGNKQNGKHGGFPHCCCPFPAGAHSTSMNTDSFLCITVLTHPSVSITAREPAWTRCAWPNARSSPQ